MPTNGNLLGISFVILYQILETSTPIKEKKQNKQNLLSATNPSTKKVSYHWPKLS